MRAWVARARALRWGRLQRLWRRTRRPLGWGLAAVLTVLTLYAASPYATLWRLHRAATRGDQATLAQLVNLDAMRGELARRLDKDAGSAIGTVSDAFVEWLDAGIRRHGANAPRALVTLDWIRAQLGTVASSEPGLSARLFRGFFTGWRHFEARIERPASHPLILGLRLDRHGWRLAMVYD